MSKKNGKYGLKIRVLFDQEKWDSYDPTVVKFHYETAAERDEAEEKYAKLLSTVLISPNPQQNIVNLKTLAFRADCFIGYKITKTDPEPEDAGEDNPEI